MKNKFIYNAIIVFGTFALMLLPKSCANTSGAPEGGPKDTIPPVLVLTHPLPNSVNHPTAKRKNTIFFEFNEYVALKDQNKNFFLSPPQAKPPVSKIRGKQIVITFEEPLDSNQTYSFSLGEAVKDNNEGNPFAPFTLSFSTGDHIDTMFVSGTIYNSSNMMPMKGITVLFHTDLSDSALFKVLPRAAAKSDSWGYFVVRNLPRDSVFRVYAIEDLNNNNLYDPESEKVAFLDSLLIPDSVMRADSPELSIVDMKDTAACMARPSQITLSMFKEFNTRQFLRTKERLAKRQIYLKFGAPYPQIDSIIIDGIPNDRIIREYNYYKDSIILWINDQGPVHDTLRMRVSYMKTDDSLKILVPWTDTLRMIKPKGKFIENKRGEMIEEIDTVSKLTIDAAPEKVNIDGISLMFESPMIKAPFDSIIFTEKNTREQISRAKFTIEADSLDLKHYIFRPAEPLKIGFEYELKIRDSLFMDIDGNYCDSLVKKITLPKDENLSHLSIDVQGVNEFYVVELVDERRKKVFFKYFIDKDAVLEFPYLKKGKYSVRITEDKNRNGQIDTGVLLEKKQPEKVLMYKFNNRLGNNAYILDLPERTELTQTINIAEMFK